MLRFLPHNIDSVLTSGFYNSKPIKAYSVVYIDDKQSRNYRNVVITDDKTAGKPLGLIMENVVEYKTLEKRLLNHNEVPVGSKVNVIQRGPIIIHKDNIIDHETNPLPLSKLYFDVKYEKFTFQKTKYCIGKTQSMFDVDGYMKVSINFEDI